MIMAEADPSTAIVLNCFGRGCSSILWNFIGSSPDVLMPRNEWHQGFYGDWLYVGRILRFLTRQRGLNIPAMPPLPALVRRRAIRSVSSDTHGNRPESARNIVLKLMDHHIAWNNVIQASFPVVRQVVLVRHPYSQCESLLRTGLSEDEAIRWYVDVMVRMEAVMKSPDAVLIRFEDFVRSPIGSIEKVYEALEINLPYSGGFFMKQKRFGAERTSDSLAIGDLIVVNAGNASTLIDSTVNEKAAARLSPEYRARVWDKTGSVASAFGYHQDP